MTNLSSSLDRQCTWVAGLLSGTAAIAVLVLTPKDVLSFDTTAASKDVSLALGAFMRSRATTPEGKELCQSFRKTEKESVENKTQEHKSCPVATIVIGPLCNDVCTWRMVNAAFVYPETWPCCLLGMLT